MSHDLSHKPKDLTYLLLSLAAPVCLLPLQQDLCESIALDETTFRLHVTFRPSHLLKPLHTLFRMNNPQSEFEPKATARQREGVILD
jgi:hypothetical protein